MGKQAGIEIHSETENKSIVVAHTKRLVLHKERSDQPYEYTAATPNVKCLCLALDKLDADEALEHGWQPIDTDVAEALDRLADNNAKLNERIHTLEAGNKELGATSLTLQEVLKEKDSQLADLQAALDAENKAKVAAYDELTEKDRRIANYQEALESNDIAALNTTIEQLRSNLEQAEQTIKGQDERILLLRGSAEPVQPRYEQWRSTLEQEAASPSGKQRLIPPDELPLRRMVDPVFAYKQTRSIVAIKHLRRGYESTKYDPHIPDRVKVAVLWFIHATEQQWEAQSAVDRAVQDYPEAPEGNEPTEHEQNEQSAISEELATDIVDYVLATAQREPCIEYVLRLTRKL